MVTEVLRAQNAEADLTNKLLAETQRAEAAEKGLVSQYTGGASTVVGALTP